MRSSFLAATIAAMLCGVAHAQVTFMPLQTRGAQLTKISGNGSYATGVGGIGSALRWSASGSPQEEVITGLASSGGVNNWGELSVSVPVNGGAAGGGTDLGAYVPPNRSVPVRQACALLSRMGLSSSERRAAHSLPCAAMRT